MLNRCIHVQSVKSVATEFTSLPSTGNCERFCVVIELLSSFILESSDDAIKENSFLKSILTKDKLLRTFQLLIELTPDFPQYPPTVKTMTGFTLYNAETLRDGKSAGGSFLPKVPQWAGDSPISTVLLDVMKYCVILLAMLHGTQTAPSYPLKFQDSATSLKFLIEKQLRCVGKKGIPYETCTPTKGFVDNRDNLIEKFQILSQSQVAAFKWLADMFPEIKDVCYENKSPERIIRTLQQEAAQCKLLTRMIKEISNEISVLQDEIKKVISSEGELLYNVSEADLLLLGSDKGLMESLKVEKRKLLHSAEEKYKMFVKDKIKQSDFKNRLQSYFQLQISAYKIEFFFRICAGSK